MKIGFAGAGNMAAAMARGWAASDGGPEAMLFTDAGSGRAARLAEEVGGEAVGTLAELGGSSDLVVLAVKPGALDAVATELSSSAPAVLSLLGGTSLGRLREAFGEVPVARVIPNVAVEAGRGVMCHAPLERVPGEMAARIVDLLGLLGRTIEVEDRLLDEAQALMSCSPAYVALVVEALADAGIREGLDGQVAHEMVIETMAGTAELLRRRDTLALRRAVASPGGSTVAGLDALERAGVRAALADAVSASLERMRG
jgi:pyrroline-5-carboxylate reductase